MDKNHRLGILIAGATIAVGIAGFGVASIAGAIAKPYTPISHSKAETRQENQTNLEDGQDLAGNSAGSWVPVPLADTRRPTKWVAATPDLLATRDLAERRNQRFVIVDLYSAQQPIMELVGNFTIQEYDDTHIILLVETGENIYRPLKFPIFDSVDWRIEQHETNSADFMIKLTHYTGRASGTTIHVGG